MRQNLEQACSGEVRVKIKTDLVCCQTSISELVTVGLLYSQKNQASCKGNSSSNTDFQAGQSNQTPEHVFLFVDYKGSQGWLALMWVTTLFLSKKSHSWFLCPANNILSRHTACDSWTGSTPFAKSGIAKLQNGLMNFKCSIFAHRRLYGVNIIKSLIT